MELVPGPLQTPGVCVACKGGASRECVDTHQKVGNWRVYICVQCFHEMAHLFNYIKGDQAQADVQNLLDTVDQLGQALEEERGKQLRVVAVDDVVPYLKKAEERPRKDGEIPETEVQPTQAVGVKLA